MLPTLTKISIINFDIKILIILPMKRFIYESESLKKKIALAFE